MYNVYSKQEVQHSYKLEVVRVAWWSFESVSGLRTPNFLKALKRGTNDPSKKTAEFLGQMKVWVMLLIKMHTSVEDYIGVESWKNWSLEALKLSIPVRKMRG